MAQELKTGLFQYPPVFLNFAFFSFFRFFAQKTLKNIFGTAFRIVQHPNAGQNIQQTTFQILSDL